MIKGIIFDLDGVICFTDHYHYLAWKQLADKLNIYFDETINNRLRGISRMDSLEIILEKSDKKYSQEEKENLAREKNEIYRKYLLEMSEKDLSQEVKETLIELRNKGYKLAIGSSSKNTKTILKQIGLGDFFDAISDGNNITNSKPDPEVFLKAADYLNISPEDSAVIEDAIAGIEAAHRGNFTAIGISDAKKSEFCDYNIDTFKDLLKIL